MMNDLLLPSPEMKQKAARRCDNKYILWLVITILALGLFITGFRYSGHRNKGRAFLNHKLPSNGTYYPTQAGTTEGSSRYYPTVGENEDEDGTSAGYENPATEFGVTPGPVKEDNIEKSYVLIFTEGRAGSTWLSSFFWNTPDTFYVYEPLHYTPALHQHHCHDSAMHRKACNQEILTNIYTCDFQSSELTVLGQYPSYKKHCKNCTTIQLQDQCKRSAIIIPKVASLIDMNDLEDLVVDKRLDVRVVHLVRDARPLVQARSSTDYGTIDGFHQHPTDGYSDEMLSEESQVLCDRVLAASKLGDNPPTWLSGRYKRITYEALSANPVAVAKDIYSFAELPWNAQIEQAIFNSTTAKGIPATDSWKSTMGKHSIDIVTESCHDMLEYLGYLNAVTPEVKPEVGAGDEITDQVEEANNEQVQSGQVQSGQGENTVESSEASTLNQGGTMIEETDNALENVVETQDVGESL